MPPITLRIRTAWGTNRITISPADSIADLKREIAHRSSLGVSGSDITLSSNTTSLSSNSSSIRSCNLKNGDQLQANIIQPTKQSTNSSSKRDDDDNNNNNGASKNNTNFDISKRVMVASLEGTTGRFLSEGNVVPLAPTIEGRKQQRLVSQTAAAAAKYGARRFTEPTPYNTSNDQNNYISWTDWLRARTNPSTGRITTELDLERELSSTLLTRRGANVLPPTVTVQRQQYRHVDRVTLRNQLEIKRFAAGWIDNHVQRCGFLIGTYSEYSPSFPSSSSASSTSMSSSSKQNSRNTQIRVEAIYEPAQLSDISGVRLSLENGGHDEMRDVLRIAKLMNMNVVGFIFTHPSREEKLTSEEVRLASRYQEEYRSMDTFGNSGIQTSKFVTMTLTKNTKNEIVPRAFMASDTCMVLERNVMLDDVNLALDQENITYLRKPKPGRILPIIVAQGVAQEREGERPRIVLKKDLRQSFPTELLIVELDIMNEKNTEGTNEKGNGNSNGNNGNKKTTATHVGVAMLTSRYQVENRQPKQSNQLVVRRYLATALSQSPRPSLESLLWDFHLLLQFPAIFGFDIIEKVLNDLKYGKRLSSYTRAIVNAFVNDN